MNRRSSPRRIALLFGLFLAGALAGTAQPFDRYRNVAPWDSVFRIGAHLVPGPASLARDTLKLDFTYHYLAPSVAAIAAPGTWEDTLTRDLYMQPGRPSSVAPLQTIFRLPILEALEHMVLATDN